MAGGLPPRQRSAIVRVAGLGVVNAMVFQEVLSAYDPRVKTLKKVLAEPAPDLASALIAHWQFILDEINYYPIFQMAAEVLRAIPSSPDIEKALRFQAERALNIVSQRAALRHDLMGRVYHLLLADAKYLGAYYTSVSAATLLLKLALQPQRWQHDWADQQSLASLRVADLACGTGTLLMATAEAIVDNYVRACAALGQSPDLTGIHRVLMEEIIHGYDVQPSALHLTASTLALRTPQVAFTRMRLFSLPLGQRIGRGKRHLGSIEFLTQEEIPMFLDLFGGRIGATQVSGKGPPKRGSARLPQLDLCVMNPPFTRSVGGNLLFGSMPQRERTEMQKRLSSMLKGSDILANATAGLGAVFVAVADRHLRRGGRLALVLPKALLSGVAWEKTRTLLARRYQVEYLVVSHHPDHWNFSENTHLSEVLVVARKVDGKADWQSPVVCVNLWRNPATAVEGLGLARAVARESAPDVETGQGALEPHIGEEKFAEVVTVPWARLHDRIWMYPCSFAQAELVRALYRLLSGIVRTPDSGGSVNLPLCPLGDLGELGPDRRDIHDGFRLAKRKTAYPAFWGHDAALVSTLAQEPNTHLSALSTEQRGRPLRNAELLWSRAGTVLLAERLRLNTQRAAGLRLATKVLSNVWWPVALHEEDADAEKILVMWLNCTLGLLLLLGHREETEGPWVDFKKPVLQAMPVLDPRAVTTEGRHGIAKGFDNLAKQELLPFSLMAQDEVRRELDGVLEQALGLPDLSVLRGLLAQEPILTLRPL
jgi:hypothetical protein